MRKFGSSVVWRIRPAATEWGVTFLRRLAWVVGLAWGGLAAPMGVPSATGQVMISEFLAQNDLNRKDEDGDYSDWIELHNPGSTAARLGGWTLTDEVSNPRKWEFPEVTLEPGGYLLVWASNKDRRVPGKPLHANFQLASNGEYLALIRPDGAPSTAFSPGYPVQVSDVSYGFPVTATGRTLLGIGGPGRFFVPPDGRLGISWVTTGFDDASWVSVTNGVGFDLRTETNLVPVGDSAADWTTSGEQGRTGWTYGWYNRTADPNGVYSVEEFTAFAPSDWNGAEFRTATLGTGFGYVDAKGGRPIGTNNGGERWVIRRWKSTVAGDVGVTWRIAKKAVGGSGVSGRVYHNGVQQDTAVIAGGDLGGVTRSLTLTGVRVGDVIDLALSPLGSTGSYDGTGDDALISMNLTGAGSLDGFIRSDVSAFMKDLHPSAYLRLPLVVTDVADLDALELRLRYDDGFVVHLNGVPLLRRNAPVAAVGGVVADPGDDWSSAGEQGAKGWYYGFYDRSRDGDGSYDPVGDFRNTGASWGWNGSAWAQGPSDPPWTFIGRDGWHPNGGAGGVNVQWAIRRWISQTEGTVKVLLQVAKGNAACGNGVTFRLLVNGREKFVRVLSYDDTAGFTGTVVLEALNFGDFVDFALDPTGTDGSTQDGCDGSTFAARILQDPAADTAWDSTSIRARTAEETARLETFDVSRARDFLVPGTNVLAVQVLNASATDGDFLFQAEVVGRYRRLSGDGGSYFSPPTPAAANTGGTPTPGAVIEGVTHAPDRPGDGDDLVVTARVRRTRNEIAGVNLIYRIMFTAEVTVPMFDDGRHDDGGVGDGEWGARIPAGSSVPGQMIRWAVTTRDVTGATQRSPVFADAKRSPQYHGTVVVDPGLLTNAIPVLHWFVQTPTAADTDTGTRGALYFNGEFHDNVGANAHGQSTRGFPKRSYDLDFNPGHKFRWRAGQPRVDDINLLTTWADKSHLRNVLAYETYARAGAQAHFAVPVRVEQNGKFFSIANLVENGDDNFLRRLGLDPAGALYKMYNTADSASGGEKKTRKTEGTQDLAQLISALGSGTTANRLNAMYDRLDLPQVVNFLATRALTGDTDCCHKNYYLYRDSDRTGEWLAFPWDVDLSFGRVWTCNSPCLAYFDETIYTNTGMYVGNNNTVFALVLNTPATRQMYLRRFRTLMEELTQPPTVAPEDDLWRRRTTQLRDQLAPDAARDLAKWGSWGRRESITQAVDRIHREFLPGRRQYLFTRGAGNILPATQPEGAQVRIAAVDRGVPGQPATGFLLLTNANAYAVDLSGWLLEGTVRLRFKPGTVLPSRSSAVVSADRVVFRTRTASPKGGEGRLVLGDYEGNLDAHGGMIALRDPKGRAVHVFEVSPSTSPAQQFLRLTEIHFHPAGDPPGAEVEFLELMNIGTESVDLTGVRLVEGVRFDFGTGAIRRLAGGARVVVTGDEVAFRRRYGPDVPVAGTWLGQLDNGGERLRLVDSADGTILDFEFHPVWAPTADGFGFSLVVENERADWTAWSQPSQWRVGGVPGGTPGKIESSLPSPGTGVRVNEILAHAASPGVDAVELFNASAAAIPVGGWWLSDHRGAPKKYRIPPGLVLGPGEYLAIDETRFNEPVGAPTSFGLSARGDEIWLFAADAAGALTGYADGTRFPASASGESFGWMLDSTGEIHWVPQIRPTVGTTNAGPRVGPVIIHEVQVRPDPGDAGFVELLNTGESPVPLFDVLAPTNTWRLSGVDFVFPPGVVLPAGGLAVVVGTDPAFFRLLHGVPAGVPVFGPWLGVLAREGERLALERPEPRDPFVGAGEVPAWIVVDEVRFLDRPPWPDLNQHPGSSLERVEARSWAGDPANWRASTSEATPGLDKFGAWMRQHFTSPELADAAVGAEWADPDHDGQSNWAEFRSGTMPRDGTSVLRWERVVADRDGLRLRFQAMAGREYRVEWSRSPGDPAGWTEWRRIAPEPQARVVELTEGEVPVQSEARFFRIRVP